MTLLTPIRISREPGPRKFGGETYDLVDSGFDHQEARSLAVEIRRNGCAGVRFAKISDRHGYGVYVLGGYHGSRWWV